MVLGVVADGLDELVGACVEGDHVLGGVILGRSVLVHGVHGPVAGHFCVRVDRNVAVVGGEAPAGEDLALDGRCLDAECVLGEGGAFLPGDSLDAVSVSGVERHRGEFFFSLSGSCRILILGSISHCDCRCQGSQSRYSCNARNDLFAKRHLGNPLTFGKPFLSYVTNCPKAMPSKYRPECVEFPLIRTPKDYDSCPLATFSRG